MACNKQLVPCDTTAMSANYELVSWPPTSQPRIRTNIVLLKPLSFYIPDDDDSVPYAFMLGRHTISTAGGGCEEALLSGYFSALCAVLPDLTNIANKVMTNLDFQVEEIAVPSQADRMNIVIPQSQNLRLEIIKFAQMCLLPFQIRFDSDINIFWGEVAKDAGVVVADDSSQCRWYGNSEHCVGGQPTKRGTAKQHGFYTGELAIIRSPFGHIISEAIKQAKNYVAEVRLSSGFSVAMKMYCLV